MKEQDAILGPCGSICFGNVAYPSNDLKMLRLMQHLLFEREHKETIVVIKHACMSQCEIPFQQFS